MEMYNKHYITVDAENRITNGFSDAFRQPAETDICINEQGGYQFRLFPGGEENPSLFDWDGMIPLYKWDGGYVKLRTEEEIEAERALASLPTADEVRAQRDKLLAETDWTQVLDAPISAESREAFRVYRQALRDITEQAGFPADVVWPEMPEAVKAAPDPVDTAFDVLIGEEET